ncbi:MAG: O-antigen ligase family protein, partial [Immundisolibacteraceae bacterium]|nr:O-antigen ligase family protein [Immundisolibacteraceae bacterium]
SQVFRPSGLLLHANIFGIYQATVLPFIIGTFLISKHPLYRLFLIIAVLMGTVGLLLSQSRAAWVSFALAFVLLFTLMMMHRRLARQVLLAAVGSSIALIVALALFSDRILKRLFSSKNDATVGREVFLSDFYRLISDHWMFGTGLNSYTAAVEPYLSFSISVYDNWVPPVHNIYYLWWGETGVLGFLLYMAFWAGIIWKAIQNIKTDNDTLFVINAACLAAMLGFFFDGFLGFALRVNQPQRIFFFIGALVFAIHYSQFSKPIQTTTSRPPL